jgi:hypothetical protein
MLRQGMQLKDWIAKKKKKKNPGFMELVAD